MPKHQLAEEPAGFSTFLPDGTEGSSTRQIFEGKVIASTAAHYFAKLPSSYFRPAHSDQAAAVLGNASGAEQYPEYIPVTNADVALKTIQSSQDTRTKKTATIVNLESCYGIRNHSSMLDYSHRDSLRILLVTISI